MSEATCGDREDEPDVALLVRATVIVVKWLIAVRRQRTRSAASPALFQLVQARRQRGGKLFATSSAIRSLVSSATFCASITSPATRSSFGTKHQPATGRPQQSSS